MHLYPVKSGGSSLLIKKFVSETAAEACHYDPRL